MRKINLLFYLLFFSCGLFAQNQIDAKGKKQGYWQKTFPNSKAVDYIGQFKDDQPIGTFIYYFPSGKKKAQITYISSNTTYTIMYHENEVMLAQGKFVNKLKDSTWNYYTITGSLNSIENYKLGVLHGEKIVYYSKINEAGKIQIAQKMNYNEGKLNGTQYDYFDNGVIWRQNTYVNGIKTGTWLTYNPYGKIILKDNYEKDYKNGWCYAYDDDGIETSKVYYKLGERLTEEQTSKYLQKLNEIKSKQVPKSIPNKK
jgi:antitoxin component YwqK of YwqJK toxin-antitoxin module